MRFPTGSNKVVAHLSTRSLKANRVRNIVAIIAIALTALLFTSVFTIGMGLKRSMEESTFRMSGGYAHGTFKDLTEEQYEKIGGHPSIQAKGRTKILGNPDNQELLKHYTEIRYTDENTSKWMYMEIEEGSAPEGMDEVAMDTQVLDALGIPHELGAKVPLIFTVGSATFEEELTLTGYWERVEGADVSQIRVSEAFVDAYTKDIPDTGTDHFLGKVTMDVMLDSSFNIENKINQIVMDLGFVPDGEGENSINVGINWAYIGSSDTVDPMVVIGLVGAILLIMFTGYLIIYNVFQISIMSDIRFYGLLKTIGMTPRQIKRMVRRQAICLSTVGIPIGLLIGYGIGNRLLPLIMNTSTIKITKVSTSPSIFIGAAFFALVTVFISCRKPGKMAARIAPIEASKYSEVEAGKTTERKATKNTALHMAYRNMTRNKKKAMIVVASLALSVVLLNSVYTYTEGFDMDKYLSKNVVADFVLGGANYFNVGKHFTGLDDVPSSQYVKAVANQEGVEKVGAVYYEPSLPRENKMGRSVQLYGVQDQLLDKLQVIEGSIDVEKYNTKNYILEVLWADDNGNVDRTLSEYAIGEQVVLESEKSTQGATTYEVMAKVVMPHHMGVRYGTWDDKGPAKSIIMSDQRFKAYIADPLVMAYYVDVADGYDTSIEAFVEKYTTEVEPTMDYESKKYFADEFKGMKDMFFTVGFIASAIIGMVGVINFINVIFTSILSRRGEFAILQSIGMTTKQLRCVLILEGVLYAGITSVVVTILSMLISWFIVKPLCGGIWFFTYQFKFMPVALSIPCMFALGVLIPAFIQKIVGKQTLVERLRKIN